MRWVAPHNVDDAMKVAEIATSLRANGWTGAPIVVWGESDALTGTHRLAACEVAGIEPETITLEEVFAEDDADWNEAMRLYNEGTTGIVGIDIVPALNLLSDATRAKYGIDLH